MRSLRKVYRDARITKIRLIDSQCKARYYRDAARCFRDIAAAKEVALGAGKLAENVWRATDDPAVRKELTKIINISKAVASGRAKIVELVLKIKEAIKSGLRKIPEFFKSAFNKIAEKLKGLKESIQAKKEAMESNKMVRQANAQMAKNIEALENDPKLLVQIKNNGRPSITPRREVLNNRKHNPQFGKRLL